MKYQRISSLTKCQVTGFRRRSTLQRSSGLLTISRTPQEGRRTGCCHCHEPDALYRLFRAWDAMVCGQLFNSATPGNRSKKESDRQVALIGKPGDFGIRADGPDRRILAPQSFTGEWEKRHFQA